jgi:hypothetical protein
VQELVDEVVSVKQETVGPARTWLNTLMSQCQIKGFVELSGVSALVRLSGDAHCASVGFSRSNTKFLIVKCTDMQGNATVFLFYILLCVYLL